MNIKVTQKLISLALVSSIVLLTNPSYVLANDNSECIEDRSIDDKLVIDAIKTKDTLVFREDNNINSKSLGYIPANDIFVPISIEDDWYKINYNGVEGYIKSDYTEPTTIEDMPYYCIKIGYINSDTDLFDSATLTRELDSINKYEFVEIYKEDNYSYLVKADNEVGYVPKDIVEELDYNSTGAVLDISNQEVIVYDNGEIVLKAPVVTGNVSKNKKNDHSTGLGLYHVFEKSRNRDLVGPRNSYRSYVNYMVKFNPNGEGFHDANYHVDEFGKKRGWRSDSEFGGNTYKGNGSHGCANMLYPAAKLLYETMDYNDWVLVKQ